MTSVIRKSLPFFASGIVVKGFGRGSKELGIPTGTLFGILIMLKMYLGSYLETLFSNDQKNMETHIINQFPEDFYGSILRVAILGYLRPEKDFSSLEELKSAITDDIREAERLLDQPHYLIYRDHSFFHSKNGTAFPPQNNGYSL
ncbi:riboflavin kinase-like [Centruroides sculpturatus]|uniref:riboflavin kinase-like n=1 Tax=Centruroides sculpturatus TaxID=218467 RepID=UPI000C6D4122|nr:riboflavin kinase-like [Centruroides sculpturatus]